MAVGLYSKFMGLIFCFCSRVMGLVFGLGLACIFSKRLMQSRKRLFFDYVFNYSMNFQKNYGRVSFSTTASIGIGWWNRSLRTFICGLALGSTSTVHQILIQRKMIIHGGLV